MRRGAGLGYPCIKSFSQTLTLNRHHVSDNLRAYGYLTNINTIVHGDDSRKPRDISSRPVLSPVTLARRRTSNALPHSSPPPLSSRLTGSTLYGDESSASSENLQSTRQNSRDSTKTTLSDATLDNTDIVSPESTIPEHVRAEIQRILRNEPELLRQALQQPKATQSLFSCVKAGISTGFKKFLKDSKNPVKSDTRMWDVGPV